MSGSNEASIAPCFVFTGLGANRGCVVKNLFLSLVSVVPLCDLSSTAFLTLQGALAWCFAFLVLGAIRDGTVPEILSFGFAVPKYFGEGPNVCRLRRAAISAWNALWPHSPGTGRT